MKKTMETQTKVLLEGIDELIDICMKQSGGFMCIKDMDDESLLALRRCLEIIDVAKGYTLEMAKKLDQIDRLEEIEKKLDVIIERTKEK